MTEGRKFWLQVMATAVALLITLMIMLAIEGEWAGEKLLTKALETKLLTWASIVLFVATVWSGINQSRSWFITFGSVFLFLLVWQTAPAQEWITEGDPISGTLWLGGVEVPTKDGITRAILFRTAGFVTFMVILAYGVYDLLQTSGKWPQRLAYVTIIGVVKFWLLTVVLGNTGIELLDQLGQQYVEDINGLLSQIVHGTTYTIKADWRPALIGAAIALLLAFMFFGGAMRQKFFSAVVVLALLVGAVSVVYLVGSRLFNQPQQTQAMTSSHTTISDSADRVQLGPGQVWRWSKIDEYCAMHKRAAGVALKETVEDGVQILVFTNTTNKILFVEYKYVPEGSDWLGLHCTPD